MDFKHLLKTLRTRLRRYFSPLFLALLVAAFILWYIAKLNYTYTTERRVRVDVDGVPFAVTCVVKGAGTSLFRENIKKRTLHIPLSELKYRRSREAGDENRIDIDSASLQHAIAARLGDLEIEVQSVADIPEIERPAPVPLKKS